VCVAVQQLCLWRMPGVCVCDVSEQHIGVGLSLCLLHCKQSCRCICRLCISQLSWGYAVILREGVLPQLEAVLLCVSLQLCC
jgi:hypothetical protein